MLMKKLLLTKGSNLLYVWQRYSIIEDSDRNCPKKGLSAKYRETRQMLVLHFTQRSLGNRHEKEHQVILMTKLPLTKHGRYLVEVNLALAEQTHFYDECFMSST